MSLGGFSGVISYPTFTELDAILTRRFEVLASALEFGQPTFLFRWPGGQIPHRDVQEQVFNELDEVAEELRVWPVVRWKDKNEGVYIVRFVPIQKEGESDIRINYALFVTTLATISLGGFMQAVSPVFLSLFYPLGWTTWDLFLVTGTFLLGLMGIIGTHEMGHYLTAKRRKIEATPPYFIPGLPDIGGTFGAFIKQKSPPRERTDLFDLGLAGPFAGFIVTLVVLFVGFFLSVPVTADELTAIDEAFPNMTGSLPVPLLFTLLEIAFQGYIPDGGTLFLHPLAFAAWVGCLVTALNLFPASQLDGGHALRAIVGPKIHKYIGWAALGLMVISGFFLMAILVFMLSGGGEHPGPLNDTVPISRSRIVLFVIAMIVLVLCIPPLSFSFF
ncbi:MAG: site-2 protease family protein [Candidatus Thorarchaeota archaeon]|nr:site-2 protease family protein [Candidatus Thorarchaeota archaeon]